MIVKISIIQNNDEIDYITREIPYSGWGGYNIVAGLVNDLFLLMRRTFVKNNRFNWIIQQMGKIDFTIKD